MDFIQAIVLGIVQGLTEFLPVSSSGHLRIVPAFLGWEDPGTAFTAVVQIGTMLAVLLYFRKDLWSIAGGWLSGVRHRSRRGTLEYRMGWYIVLGTIPICVFGLAFSDQIETEARNLYLIGTTLIVLGVVLLLADKLGRHERQVENITIRDGIIIGFAQALALIPGVSRSGATICMALLIGFSRSDAARFSFLLSIPAIAGAGILEAREAFRVLGRDAIPALAVGTGVAAVSGYMAIAWLIKWLGSHDLVGFAVYRILAGLALLGALMARVI